MITGDFKISYEVLGVKNGSWVYEKHTTRRGLKRENGNQKEGYP